MLIRSAFLLVLVFSFIVACGKKSESGFKVPADYDFYIYLGERILNLDKSMMISLKLITQGNKVYPSILFSFLRDLSDSEASDLFKSTGLSHQYDVKRIDGRTFRLISLTKLATEGTGSQTNFKDFRELDDNFEPSGIMKLYQRNSFGKIEEVFNCKEGKDTKNEVYFGAPLRYLNTLASTYGDKDFKNLRKSLYLDDVEDLSLGLKVLSSNGDYDLLFFLPYSVWNTVKFFLRENVETKNEYEVYNIDNFIIYGRRQGDTYILGTNKDKLVFSESFYGIRFGLNYSELLSVFENLEKKYGNLKGIKGELSSENLPKYFNGIYLSLPFNLNSNKISFLKSSCVVDFSKD